MPRAIPTPGEFPSLVWDRVARIARHYEAAPALGPTDCGLAIRRRWLMGVAFGVALDGGSIGDACRRHAEMAARLDGRSSFPRFVAACLEEDRQRFVNHVEGAFRWALGKY